MIINFKDVQDFNKKIISLGFTQRSFAKEIGISGPYFNQIVNENRYPSPKVAKKICDAVGSTFDEIFFVNQDNKSYQTKTIA